MKPIHRITLWIFSSILLTSCGSTATPIASLEPLSTAPATDVPGISYYVGEPQSISLEMKDSDRIIEVKQVLGLGDRYSGNEYVTSQVLDELSINEAGISLLASTPGNYRLNVTIGNDTATEDIQVDVPVGWPRGENPFSVRGAAIDTWGPPEWVDLENVPNVIDIAVEYGANYIEIVPWWNADGSIQDHQIVPCTAEAACVTPGDDMVRAWIQHAHSKGLQVLLKPHLIGGVFHRNTVSYDFESWQIQPSSPDQWFEDYQDFILHYAQIAEEEKVEIFAIGNELNGTHQYTSRWITVIEAVKEVYHGPLTYSDPYLWQMWDGQAQFWDQLNYIGIPYYYLGPDTTTPAIPDLEAEVTKVQARNLTKAMNQVDIPLIATEFGRPNFDGTGRNFTDWSNAVVDNQEIVDVMEAYLNTMVDLGPRFDGLFIWKLQTTKTTQPIDWDFRDKPLGEAIRLWFSN